jgi:hypothetical protein
MERRRGAIVFSAMATASFQDRGTADTENFRRSHPRLPDPQKGTAVSLSILLCFLFSLWLPELVATEKHWAFVPPARESGRNIDWFIKRQLQQKGTGFSQEAARLTIARRVALVLTGLPLEPARAKKFAADKKSARYGRLVDELLASERFGEHRARYWLDAVRYADTHGLHMDNRRAIHPYRDWVVRAFNSNLPLNQFIKWQIAGDLYSDSTRDRLIATGFIRLNPTTGEDGSLYEEFQAVNSFDRVETLGTALLGMTFTCARCHDHKYDPVSQKDYYRLMAYFNSTQEASLDDGVYQYEPVIMGPKDEDARRQWGELMEEADRSVGHFSVVVPKSINDAPGWTASQWMISREIMATDPEPKDFHYYKVSDLPGISREKLPFSGDQARWVTFQMELTRDRIIWLRYGSGSGHRLAIDGVLQTNGVRIAQLDLEKGRHIITLKLTGSADRNPLEVYLEDPLRGGSLLRMWAEAKKDLNLLSLARRIDTARDEFEPTLVARERNPPRVTRMLKRGQYDRPIGDPLRPGVPAALGGTTNGLATNRLGLARWLTDQANPLVARVSVNRMWQQVFGAGLVRTPEDFGRRGEPPTHPELLDWLAVELMQSGWNVKHLFRLMVASRAFRQESAWPKDRDDPENRLWARGPRHRLDAEVIRDVGLWAGGLLDLRMGGEGVKPWQPAGLWEALAHPKSNTRTYQPDDDVFAHRRSLYLYWKRSSPHPMMTLFDAPTREASCVRRSRSNTAAQSLALLNERHRVQMAQAIAQRIASGQDDRQRIHQLYWLLIGRGPRDAELKICARLLEQLRERSAEIETWPKLVIAVMASDAAITLN